MTDDSATISIRLDTDNMPGFNAQILAVLSKYQVVLNEVDKEIDAHSASKLLAEEDKQALKESIKDAVLRGYERIAQDFQHKHVETEQQEQMAFDYERGTTE